MVDYLECRGCRSFHWIPGCASGGQIIRCAHVIKPVGAPCPGFWPNTGPVTPKPEAPTVTPLLVDELAKAARDLTLELSSFLMEEAREVWGNTNVACVVTKRDRLNEVLAQYQKEVGGG